MRKGAISLILGMSWTLIVAGGCAKHELVKSDQPIAPAPVNAEKSKEQAVKQTPVKTETIKEQPVAQEKKSAVQEKLEPIPNAGELTAELEKVFFAFDMYALSQDARASLVKNAAILKKEPAVRVQIEGHCDERGSDEYNLALGEKRAKAAMSYLVTMGIPAERLSTISFGKEKPADPGHDEAAWAKNRRDEFIITKK